MRKNAFVLAAAISAASVATSVNAETLSYGGVNYTFGPESLLADPYSSTNYGATEYVYPDGTVLAPPSEYVEYPIVDQQFSVVAEPYVMPYETVESDPSVVTGYYPAYGQNGVASNQIDGVVYETIYSSEAPLLESGQVIQTY